MDAASAVPGTLRSMVRVFPVAPLGSPDIGHLEYLALRRERVAVNPALEPDAPPQKSQHEGFNGSLS